MILADIISKYKLIQQKYKSTTEMQKILILTVLLAISVSRQTLNPSPPMWSSSFYVAYDETFTRDGHSYTFNGQFFYDAANNRQRSDKLTGRYDPTCSSILPNVTTRCQHLVANDKRYIVFPEKSQCCFCCDASHGCGIVKQDWFKDGKYLGQERIVDMMYDKWVKPDIADAFYWATPDENEIPRRFSEDNHTHVIDYLTHTFVNKTIDSTVFNVPAYCNVTCPTTSVCGRFRQQKQHLVAQ